VRRIISTGSTTVRSTPGLAPHTIEWRLGSRPDGSFLLAFVGDRYAPTAASQLD
jgi:hypothetical protein